MSTTDFIFFPDMVPVSFADLGRHLQISSLFHPGNPA